jgi:predicted lipoprotein with Yx(FWY)xxD motif
VTRTISLAALAVVIGTAGAQAASMVEAGSEGVTATPRDLTLRVIRIGYGINPPGSNGNQPRDRTVFADEKGQILYTSDKDMPGKSMCGTKCTETWVPAYAPNNAAAEAHWSIISREDGKRQWAFRDRPLYTYAIENRTKEEKEASQKYLEDIVKTAKDKAEADGEVAEDNGAVKAAEEKLKAERAIASARGAGQGQGHEKEGRQVVELLPEQWVPVPNGVEVREVRTAPGQVFTNESGLPLYTLASAVEDSNIRSFWTPLEASQLALPIGDFTVVARADGIYQWAYQGQSLYTFNKDRDYGDSNGKNLDDRFKLVYALRYYMPEGVTVAQNHMYGGLLSTTDGKTLYARESNSGGSDGALRGDRGKAGIGKRIGLTGCDADCEATWNPLLASADAKPSGYWTLYDREDGEKQWAYFGYALYSYGGEIENLGSTEIYDPVFHFEAVEDGGINNKFPLHWRVAPP